MSTYTQSILTNTNAATQMQQPKCILDLSITHPNNVDVLISELLDSQLRA